MAMTDAVLGDDKHASAELTLALKLAKTREPSRAEKIRAVILLTKAHSRSQPSPIGKDLGPLDSKFITAMHNLSSGRTEDAIRSLRFLTEKDDDPLYAFFLSKAYMTNRNWQSAAESMKYVQDAKGRLPTQSDLPVVAWPLSFYYIGICEQNLGHSNEAVSSYRRFLDLWSRADTGLPQVAGARKGLARSLPKSQVE